MSDEPEPRERWLRINEKDRAAIKKVKEKQYDGEVPLGYCARIACEQMLDDTEDDSGGVKF